jgi:FkbM family methyltransferase
LNYEFTAAVPHHQVFSHFRPYTGELPPNCDLGFLGTLVPLEFIQGLTPLITYTRKVEDFYVHNDEEYFEWVDLLESVVAASGTYTMIDLGAGYGRWSVRAAYAVRQYDPKLRCRLIAVEPEPTVYGWMRRHFSNHGVSRWRNKLIHAAVSEQPGKVHFYIGGPRDSQFDRPPSAWYGQFLTKGYDLRNEARKVGKYAGFDVYLHPSGWRSIRVPSISLSTMLKKLDGVDLIDLDIEGQELVTLTAAVVGLDAKVKRLHIGTHSVEIEAGLRQLLSDHGWQCLADYSLQKKSETPWGVILFDNGVQSWVNPRL